jgi:aldose 1-epimerase
MTAIGFRDTEVSLSPMLGGAVLRLTHQGRDILRPTQSDMPKVTDTASFPLVPFCNRISKAQFVLGGHKVKLRPDDGEHAHHGHGWMRAWTVVEHSQTRCVMTYGHESNDWPWAYEARQVFEVRQGGLKVWLSVKNLSQTPMPAGLGFHPYFPLSDQTQLRSGVSGVWINDHASIPKEWHAGTRFKAWVEGDFVRDEAGLNHCYTGFQGRAELMEGADITTLRASPDCQFLQVFSPSEADFVCLLPVNHMPDPFQHANSGLRCLRSQQVSMIWMDLSF